MFYLPVGDSKLENNFLAGAGPPPTGPAPVPPGTWNYGPRALTFRVQGSWDLVSTFNWAFLLFVLREL